MRVESEPGAGSTFLIYLPEVTSAADALPPSSPDASPGGHETVLLAEDDEMVRHNVSGVLRGAGYRVLEAKDGQDAVGLHSRNVGSIDLIVVDAVMPRKSGLQVYREISARDARVRVLFTSGYSRDVFPEEFFASGKHDLIAKPYSPEALLAAVRAALTRAG